MVLLSALIFLLPLIPESAMALSWNTLCNSTNPNAPKWQQLYTNNTNSGQWAQITGCTPPPPPLPPCGSGGAPWQSGNSAARCYAPCGSTQIPYQNVNPGGACYAPCGSPQFPTQSSNPAAACYVTPIPNCAYTPITFDQTQGFYGLAYMNGVGGFQSIYSVNVWCSNGNTMVSVTYNVNFIQGAEGVFNGGSANSAPNYGAPVVITANWNAPASNGTTGCPLIDYTGGCQNVPFSVSWDGAGHLTIAGGFDGSYQGAPMNSAAIPGTTNVAGISDLAPNYVGYPWWGLYSLRYGRSYSLTPAGRGWVWNGFLYTTAFNILAPAPSCPAGTATGYPGDYNTVGRFYWPASNSPQCVVAVPNPWGLPVWGSCPTGYVPFNIGITPAKYLGVQCVDYKGGKNGRDGGGSFVKVGYLGHQGDNNYDGLSGFVKVRGGGHPRPVYHPPQPGQWCVISCSSRWHCTYGHYVAVYSNPNNIVPCIGAPISATTYQLIP